MRTRGNRARELTSELSVGAFVFTVLLGLILFTAFISRENLFSKSHRYTIHFPDVVGLRAGDNVLIKGMPVGIVKDLTLQEDGVRVLCTVKQPIVFREDYTAEIVQSSVLGGRYLQVHPGSPEAAVLPPQDLYRGQSAGDVMAEAVALIRSVRETVEGDLVQDAKAIVKNLRETLEKGEVTRNIEGLFADARDTAAQFKEIATRVNQGEGTLGKLINDDGLYAQVTNILSEGKAMLEDLRETTPVVSFTSILFGAL